MFNITRTEERRALELHYESIVFDSMGGLPSVYSGRMLKMLDSLMEERKPVWEIGREMNDLWLEEFVKNHEYRNTFLNVIKKSGVTGASITVGSLSGPSPFTFENAVRDLAEWTYLFDVLKDYFVKVLKAEDVHKAKKEGKFAVLLNFQNTTHIGDKVDNIDLFYRLGVRQIQLTYNMRNLVGDGCTERTDCGLSDFGVKVVERMNKLGILIDLSHCGHKTLMDTVEISKDPVILSHVNCKALCKHDRCKTDEEMKAVAEKGGYIGVTVVPFFLTEKGKATLNDFLDHIEHVVDLVGVDYVGVGTDDTGQADVPQKLSELYTSLLPTIGFRPEHRARFGISTYGFEHYTDWPNITKALVSRGYSDREIKKILGENYLRVLERVVG